MSEPEPEEEREPEKEDLKKNGAANLPLTAAPPDPSDEAPIGYDASLWLETATAFPPDDHPTVQRDSRFISAGRKPLVKYPKIWLTRMQLYDVFKAYLDAGIPPSALGTPFKKAEARLQDYGEAKGKNVTAFNWLIGFLLREECDNHTASTRLKRNQKYFGAAP